MSSDSCASLDHAVAPVGSAVCRCVSPASLWWRGNGGGVRGSSARS